MSGQPLQQRSVAAQEEVDVTGCIRCANHKNTGIFLLCEHPSSVYTYAEQKDFHTCAHMRREAGACGPDKRLIKHG